MRASSTFLFAAIMAAAHVAAVMPPACLLAVMGAQPNASDLKAICGTLNSQVFGNITEKCSGDAKLSAVSIYSSTCLASESVTLSIPPSATATGTNTAKTTGSGSATAAGSGPQNTGSGTGTAAGSSASATGKNAGPNNAPQVVMVVVAAGFAGQYLL